MNKQNIVFTAFLILVTSILCSQVAVAAQVGEAKMVIGKVVLQSVNGESIRLKRGGSVSVGDIVITDGRAQAQLIMVDGSNISIRPDTQFKIEEFVSTGNVEKDKTHYGLIEGGFRSVTGSIGKKNKASFELKTPVATMGIRGTDFSGKYVSKPSKESGGKSGLFLDVISGGVSMTNEGGKFNFNPDTNGYVSDANSKPGKIDELPENLLSPKAKKRKQETDDDGKSKGKSSKSNYPSPEEEFVQVGTYVAPEQKKEIFEEALAAGVPTKEIINGANFGGLSAEEILPDLIKSGEKHGMKPRDFVEPIMDSEIKSDKIINDMMVNYPDAALDILTSAFSTGEADHERLRAGARNLGIKEEDINASEALGNLLSIPKEVKELLDEDDAKNKRIRARELAPATFTQDESSPS